MCPGDCTRLFPQVLTLAKWARAGLGHFTPKGRKPKEQHHGETSPPCPLPRPWPPTGPLATPKRSKSNQFIQKSPWHQTKKMNPTPTPNP